MRTWISAVVLLGAMHSRLEASCIPAPQLAHAAVSIERYFDAQERAARSSLLGVSGTAWFLSPTTIVTAEHVSAAMLLDARDWKPIDVKDGDDTRSIPARIERVTGAGEDKLAVLTLQSEFPGARSAAVRTSPLAPDDQVITVAYPAGRARVVGGRFVKYGDAGRFAGAALLEMFDGNDRLAVDYGASGAPVFDCDGRIAAVVSIVITQDVWFFSGKTRVSTAWGTPNVMSVPIEELTKSLQSR